MEKFRRYSERNWEIENFNIFHEKKIENVKYKIQNSKFQKYLILSVFFKKKVKCKILNLKQK